MSSAQTRTCGLDTRVNLRSFSSLAKRIVFRRKADQDTSSLTVSGNNHLFFYCYTQVSRQVVFHLGQRN